MPEAKDESQGLNSGTDLSGMFKGGSVRSPREFDIEQPSYSGTPKIIGWTMKLSGGLIKNKNQAQYALLGFVIVAIIVSLFLIFGGGETKLPPEQEIFRATPPVAQ